MVIIDEAKCVGCAWCMMLCPEKAFKVWDHSEWIEEKCTDCGDCIYFCHNECITLK